jgi:hypothetical protein
LDGSSTVELLENRIKSIFESTNDPRTNVIGVVECKDSPDEELVMIPLEVLCKDVSVVDDQKWYAPQWWTVPVVDQMEQSAQNTSEQPAATEDNTQQWGYYGDPWQNDEYFGQYGKLVRNGCMYL